MTPRDRILAAFWRRGRKCFVPLMGAEIERLSRLDIRALRPALRDIAAEGKIRTEKDNGTNILLYELTEEGRVAAMQVVGALE